MQTSKGGKGALLKFKMGVRMGEKEDLNDCWVWLLVADKLVWVFYKLLIYWDYNNNITTISRAATEWSGKIGKKIFCSY